MTFKQAMNELLLSTEDEAYTIMSDLEENGRTYTVIVPNGDCLYASILSCIEHPDKYDIDMFRHQIVAFALHNMNFFKEKIITTNDKCIESYLRNVKEGLIYGDRNVLQIISMMWKMRISILNPYEELDHIWHNQGLSGVHVILCWNGHNHYSGSEFTEELHVHLQPLKSKIFVKTINKIKIPEHLLKNKKKRDERAVSDVDKVGPQSVDSQNETCEESNVEVEPSSNVQISQEIDSSTVQTNVHTSGSCDAQTASFHAQRSEVVSDSSSVCTNVSTNVTCVGLTATSKIGSICTTQTVSLSKSSARTLVTDENGNLKLPRPDPEGENVPPLQ